LIRNIIWDLDGTLFDTYPAIAKAFKAALNDLGHDAPLDWIESLAKISLGHCASTLVEKYQLTEEALEQAFDNHYSCTKPAEQPLFPGVRAVCQLIFSLGGKNVIVTHRGRTGTLELLAANQMTVYFAGYLTRDDGYPKKPDPAAFHAALQVHGLRHEETIAVGDRDIDIQAGRAAGVFTCLFGDEGDGITADLMFRNFDELYRHIKSVVE
jgi:HAD superfamily hydrolase (TIGR01509 family)